MNEDIEIIDSSRMEILSDFRYVDEPMDNIEHFYLGISENQFIISIKDLAGNKISKTFFERKNYLQLIRMLEDVYAGKLYETDQGSLVEERGKDHIIVGIMSAMPHTATRPIVRLFIKNVRTAEFDGRDRDGFYVTSSIETGKRLLSEMKRIAPQVTI